MIFITGTSTEVGKTLISRAIAGAAVRKGLRVGVMKPIETGCEERDGVLVGLDTEKLAKSANCKIPLDTINPYRFALPVSPHIAAYSAGIAIQREVILNCFEKIKKDSDFCIVEGAGGIFVPIGPDFLTIDLVKLLNLPVVIVTPDWLGTINHTLLTIEALKARNIKIKGVILSRTRHEVGLDSMTNDKTIAEYGKVEIIGTFPYLHLIGERILSECAEQYLSLDKIF